MDPNTVGQVRIAGYARRAALALERDRTDGHYAYEHADRKKPQRISAPRYPTMFDVSIQRHAHALSERTSAR